MPVSCYNMPNPSSARRCQSFTIGSDLWQLIKTSVWQEECLCFLQAHFTSNTLPNIFQPVMPMKFAFRSWNDGTNWNQINQNRAEWRLVKLDYTSNVTLYHAELFNGKSETIESCLGIHQSNCYYFTTNIHSN